MAEKLHPNQSIPAPASRPHAIVIDQHGIAQSSVPVEIHAVVEQPSQGFWQVAKDWQGLEGGVFAVVAAVLGGLFIWRQTLTNKRIETDRLTRQLRARRATLPLTLSVLLDWADECGAVLLRAYQQAEAHAKISTVSLERLPGLPTDAAPTLERFVEAANDDGAAAVANLLRDIQVFWARMLGAGFVDGAKDARSVYAEDLRSHLIGISTIAARVASLFDYSRRRAEVTPADPSWTQVRTALNLMGADKDIQPKLYQLLDEREARGVGPGYVNMDG